ncbi:hypothetical protein HK101_008503 [Irineochytrium annulatum]|nr:hypothetical protein HK101_008503 [Irineochytrium annulatum]
MTDKRQDLDRIGLFGEASYISTKEPFKDSGRSGFLINRAKGKQFLTNPPKRGHDTKDVYFDKEYIRLFENEPYTDLVVLRRRYRLLQKERNITTTPFKPSSVPPKPSGSGSLYGTIEQQWPLPKKDVAFAPAPVKQKPESKPNFLTRPPKKGSGYGYNNVTIGKSYEYISEPYDLFRESIKSDRLESRKRQIGERVFMSSSARLDFFNTFQGLIGSDGGKKGATATPASRKGLRNGAPPFKPSSCCGYTINKYPAIEAVPGEEKEGKKGAKKVGEKVQGSAHAAVFRPSGISKSYPIRSVIEATCPIAPPPWLQELMRGI